MNWPQIFACSYLVRAELRWSICPLRAAQLGKRARSAGTSHTARVTGFVVLRSRSSPLCFARPDRRLACPVDYCAQVPIVYGIQPWGLHTGAPITGATGSFACGHGQVNLLTDNVSGILCQVDRVRHHPDRLIVMTVEQHLLYHSHHALKWSYPGNEMKIDVRVRCSTDPRCAVGTVGGVTLFAS